MATFIGWANFNPWLGASIPPPGETTASNYSPSNSGTYDDDTGFPIRFYFGGNDPDAPGTYAWTPVWVPSSGDSEPPLVMFAAGSIYGRVDLQPNFAQQLPKGTLTLTCTKDGVPLDGELQLAILEDSIYGQVAWITVGGYPGTVDFVGTPQVGSFTPGSLPTSTGVVDPDNTVPLTGPLLFSELPVAEDAYSNDVVPIWRGLPAKTLRTTLGDVIAATSETVPTNSPVNQTSVEDKAISELTVSASVGRQDWVLINQGSPPRTYKVRVGFLIDFLTELANG